jgi:hypothetical protein
MIARTAGNNRRIGLAERLVRVGRVGIRLAKLEYDRSGELREAFSGTNLGLLSLCEAHVHKPVVSAWESWHQVLAHLIPYFRFLKQLTVDEGQCGLGEQIVLGNVQILVCLFREKAAPIAVESIRQIALALSNYGGRKLGSRKATLKLQEE